MTSLAQSCPAAFEMVGRYQGPCDVVLVVLLALCWIGDLLMHESALVLHTSRRSARLGISTVLNWHVQKMGCAEA